MVDNRVVSAQEVGKLAKLPPRDQLLAELVGCMEAPMQQLLYCLTAKMSELVGLVEALTAQKEGAKS
jgi:large subunit ribosomal protein L10